MRHLDLFSGIGGFAFAADQVWENVEHIFCDNDKFCQKILAKHWPNSKIYEDIRELITWFVFENILIYDICGQTVKEEQILQILKRRLKQQENRESNIPVKTVERSNSYTHVKSKSAEDFAQESVDTQKCGESFLQMRMEENGCSEKITQTGKMEEAEIEMTIIKTPQSFAGEEEFSQGMDLFAKIVGLNQKNLDNLTPITLLDGLTMSQKDLIYRMALHFALNATWLDTEHEQKVRTTTSHPEHNGITPTETIRTNNGSQSESQAREELSKSESSRSGVLRTTQTRWDLLTGGFPCQPFSQAGRRKGTSDDRFLWPQMLAIIRLKNPKHIIAENVRGLINIQNGMVFEQVCLDLEASGYEVQPLIIPAVAVNAPHRRDRVWFIANSKYQSERNTQQGRSDQRSSTGIAGSDQNDADSNSQRLEGRKRSESQHSRSGGHSSRPSISWDEDWTKVAARLCLVDDGLPNGLARPRNWRNAALKAAGNSIVPQVAEEIMKAIKYSEK